MTRPRTSSRRMRKNFLPRALVKEARRELIKSCKNASRKPSVLVSLSVEDEKGLGREAGLKQACKIEVMRREGSPLPRRLSNYHRGMRTGCSALRYTRIVPNVESAVEEADADFHLFVRTSFPTARFSRQCCAIIEVCFYAVPIGDTLAPHTVQSQRLVRPGKIDSY